MVLQAQEILAVDIASLAACHLQAGREAGVTFTSSSLSSVQAIQSTHRLRILEAWLQGREEEGIDALDWALLQDNIVEIGCGQGDQTAAIAAVMNTGPELNESIVYAMDTAPPDYGSPITLAEAQEHLIKNSDVAKKHIRFFRRNSTAKALQDLSLTSIQTMVFSHCLWYFASRKEVLEAFTVACQHKVAHLLVAEWDLSGGKYRRDDQGAGTEVGGSLRASSVPHLLAVLLQSHKPLAHNNIRLPLSPPAIKAIAAEAGWEVRAEHTIIPSPMLQDGRWEVATAIHEAQAYLNREKGAQGDEEKEEEEEERLCIKSQLYTLQQSLPAQKSEITSLDVWTCAFVPKR